MKYNIDLVREHFPALKRKAIGGNPVIYFDGPGGAQCPEVVAQAVSRYLLHHNANLGGPFSTSMETTNELRATRQLLATFMNAVSATEISFGPNMTTLAFALSRMMSTRWRPGDNIIVTQLDHDGNVRPWALAARDKGVEVREAPMDTRHGTLDIKALDALVNDRTRLVAITAAANATGTIPNLEVALASAKKVNALTVVDAVHYAPHRLIDVKAWGCDACFCSAYKFGGPHVGILYANSALRKKLKTYKVIPAPDEAPANWEKGTQNFEGIAGVRAVLNYLGHLHNGWNGDAEPTRDDFEMSFSMLQAYETMLAEHALDAFGALPGVTIHGITNREKMDHRTPTFGLSFAKTKAPDLSKALGKQGICTWSGHFYAIGVTKAYDLDAKGGLLRIGISHYNTKEEIDRCAAALKEALS